jgi:hypothetical protein
MPESHPTGDEDGHKPRPTLGPRNEPTPPRPHRRWHAPPRRPGPDHRDLLAVVHNHRQWPGSGRHQTRRQPVRRAPALVGVPARTGQGRAPGRPVTPFGSLSDPSTFPLREGASLGGATLALLPLHRRLRPPLSRQTRAGERRALRAAVLPSAGWDLTPFGTAFGGDLNG